MIGVEARAVVSYGSRGGCVKASLVSRSALSSVGRGVALGGAQRCFSATSKVCGGACAGVARRSCTVVAVAPVVRGMTTRAVPSGSCARLVVLGRTSRAPSSARMVSGVAHLGTYSRIAMAGRSVAYMPIVAPRGTIAMAHRFMSTGSTSKKSGDAMWLKPVKWIRSYWSKHSDRLKEMWRSYGYLAIGTYFSIYFTTLGISFAAVHFGLVKGPDVNRWLNNNWLKQKITNSELKVSANVEKLLVAWLITKTTEPARAALTFVLVPAMVSFLPIHILRIMRVTVPLRRQ